MSRIVSLIVLGVLLSSHTANSQHDMQRFGFYSPLDKVELDSNRFMHDMNFIGIYERGYGSKVEALRHNLMFGGAGVFYRWDSSAIWFSVMGNVLATPENNIGFDPYGASWQEEVRYSHQTSMGVFEAGFSHRCRHEIDNYDPGEKEGSTKRVTLFAGPVFGYLSPDILIANGLNFTWGIDAQYMIAASDYRNPINTRPPDISKIQYKVTPHLEAEYNLARFVDLYTRLLLTANRIDKEYYANYRAEAGVSILGSAGEIDVYVLYEDLFEDYKSPTPGGNSVFSVGVRLGSNLFR